MNYSFMNGTWFVDNSSFQEYAPKACEMINQGIYSNIGFIFKLIIILLPLILFFQWWAIIKILNSKESYDKKDLLLRYTLIMLHTLMITFCFILIYWVFLAGIDF